MIKISKGKIISYFIFIAIATIFWISTVLNKKSSYTKDIWVKIITPDSLVVLNRSVYKANVTLEGKGMDLIFESRHSKKDPLNIHISPNAKTVSKDDIEKHLSKETSKLNLNIKNIIFPLKALSVDKKTSKQVPINITGKFNFKELYGLKGNITVTPDKIKITGPSTYLDKIKKWDTQTKVFNNLSRTVKENIKLKQPSNSKIHLSRDEVLLSIPVDQYTEKKMMLPVSIAGVANDSIEILPSSVEVSVLIAVSKFDDISPDSFKANIYIDADSIKSVSYPVSIVKKPKLTKIQYTRPGYVDVYLKNNQK